MRLSVNQGIVSLCKKLFLSISLVVFIYFSGGCQPTNDACTSAKQIVITSGGFGMGLFNSTVDDISQATVQAGESFAPAILVAGQNKKSIWYKFTLPTTRTVRVILSQPGTAITTGDAGFAVYKTTNCLPGNTDISTKLTPLERFGNTYHPCVDPGEYLIQVSSNNNANGLLQVQLQISDSTGALYDHPQNAYNFGLVGQANKFVEYPVACHSIEDNNEVCTGLANASNYNKTSWHTFTTPGYFDYLAVLTGGIYSGFNQKIGYRLYEGDCKTGTANLISVGACDSLQPNAPTGNLANYKLYKCGDLKPNTTYSIQLFFTQAFFDNIRVAVVTGGLTPTQAPEPVATSFPSSNNLGSLGISISGVITNVTDQLGCNAKHSLHPCSSVMPAQGLMFNNNRYSLSSFFVFRLNTSARIDFSVRSLTPTTCGPSLLISLYKSELQGFCTNTNNLLARSNSDFTSTCLDTGVYVLQISGIDSFRNVSYTELTSTGALCVSNNLGNKLNWFLNAYDLKFLGNVSLQKSFSYDSLNANNGMTPLTPGVTYSAVPDTFGCKPTVLPNDVLCNPSITKALYREFLVADSGVVTMAGWNGWYNWNKLYKGDASALAASQNVFDFPGKITGLVPFSNCVNFGCIDANACVVPGTYTYTSFANDAYSNPITDKPTIRLNTIQTSHYTPALAQDLGNVIDSMAKYNQTSRSSDIDYFTCKDNAQFINGFQPCNNYTKAIYRQFYLKQASYVIINRTNSVCGAPNAGQLTLFSGKATDGITGLSAVGGQWSCFTSTQSTSCGALAAGWYTVVSYGRGPVYSNPTKDYPGDIGFANSFTITITVPTCTPPKYNRPERAAVDPLTNQPFVVDWGPNSGHTSAYPKTDKLFVLPKENFDCTIDTPFYRPIGCISQLVKTAYYVFKISQESYAQINTQGYWGSVYSGDARTSDSTLFSNSTLIQPCLQSSGYIQICKLQPGTYTLIIFATSAQSCNSVTPTIYTDQVGTSRSDHAKNAYDFGFMPADGVFRTGKIGEKNPLDSNRAASSDIIYCTTGARQTDPTESVCGSSYNSQIYLPGVNIPIYNGTTNATPNPWSIPRRNLWYTFTVSSGGYVKVRVQAKTPGKISPPAFAVYKSDVNGLTEFSDIVANNQVDSTIAQGLSFVASNYINSNCNDRPTEKSFYRDPCSPVRERYYVLVENANSYPNNIPGLAPNSQIDVSIAIDSLSAITAKYDKYSFAYDFGVIGQGSYSGAVDNFSCASRDVTDPVYNNTCAPKTLWYKFTTTVSGTVRFRVKAGTTNKYSWTDVHLLRQLKASDSTSTGLQIFNTNNNSVYDNTINNWWGQQCISPGTYYLLITGCNQVNENVNPEIQIIEQAGDY